MGFPARGFRLELRTVFVLRKLVIRVEEKGLSDRLDTEGVVNGVGSRGDALEDGPIGVGKG
jgi:hypothetical protein